MKGGGKEREGRPGAPCIPRQGRGDWGGRSRWGPDSSREPRAGLDAAHSAAAGPPLALGRGLRGGLDWTALSQGPKQPCAAKNHRRSGAIQQLAGAALRFLAAHCPDPSRVRAGRLENMEHGGGTSEARRGELQGKEAGFWAAQDSSLGRQGGRLQPRSFGSHNEVIQGEPH